MFNNYNIWKYCSKYFFLMIGSAYAFSFSTQLVNEKSDVSNLMGSVVFAGLFISWLVILRSDFNKLLNGLKEETKNKTEKNNE